MNLKPTRKKITVASLSVLITYFLLPLTYTLADRYLRCKDYNRADMLYSTPLGPHICDRKIDIAGSLLVKPNLMLFCFAGVLFLLIYLIYSCFEKK
ncbi:MAG: hypothetical protein A2538_05230 [Candidatus Magasanikbacteria bacterium RIFOXYD2_FULL_41_14]|uniref:Uncharacterized protein n=1 Tax=Candidatus Magasanikbacteria bacterium RIFOXYD2_FULL_41_14 TaxID=1798709 RepID=A0A1F6PBV1_9BACT|nr:MAG: hypothetical protein A2538_05230 [Candidatus Magasanikbacteria bacterium RIFOXYD2_FULL_41_14]